MARHKLGRTSGDYVRGACQEHFQRLSEGQHTISTGEQLIRHQAAKENEQEGEKVKRDVVGNTAQWMDPFSAPNERIVDGLVGGDERVPRKNAAHREASASVRAL